MKPSTPTDAVATACLPPYEEAWEGNKIMVGMVVKAKVGDMEEEIRERFSRRFSK